MKSCRERTVFLGTMLWKQLSLRVSGTLREMSLVIACLMMEFKGKTSWQELLKREVIRQYLLANRNITLKGHQLSEIAGKNFRHFVLALVICLHIQLCLNISPLDYM